MEVKDAKMMFNAGVYKEALVTKAPMERGYILTCIGQSKINDTVTGQRTGSNPRIFSSLDATAATAQKIGFRKITVTLD